ncbi:uncharacterized protein LOC113283243 isoform X1 [Papaver somniferum]|uniref:uncharacterized protein LOC113283243 isoform X1 n=1 Tax=Papaver somniferum TaxID=3469 RepID=UPI000E703701|nr:uncharacterized protein LOC113283243 isoform X1 [Papaver somniferum]
MKNNMNLESAIKPIVYLDKHMVLEKEKEDYSLCMLGRICCPFTISTSRVKKLVRDTWPMFREVGIKKFGARLNVHLYKFGSGIDIMRIKDDGPWVLDGYLMVLIEIPEMGFQFGATINMDYELFIVFMCRITTQFLTKAAYRVMASVVGELCGFPEPMGLSSEHKTVKMLIKINVTGSLPRRVLVRAQEEEAWVSVNYNVMPWRICEICRVLDHRAEPCVEGQVIVVNDTPSDSEDTAEILMDVDHVGHSGHVDMSKDGVSKATITELILEEARGSIEGLEEELLSVVNEVGGEENPIAVEEQNSGELNLVAVQIARDDNRRREHKRMVEERNRIKGKAKVDETSVGVMISPHSMDGISTGTLVIREGGKTVDLEEAIKHLDEAKEYQLKAGILLDFSVNLLEPERKKRKYKRKTTVVDENSKKTKVDQRAAISGEIILGKNLCKNEFVSPSKFLIDVCNISDSTLNMLFSTPSPRCFGEGDTNIILANTQMISVPVPNHDDPYDMFNDYIIDTPASPCPNQDAEISNEILLSTHTNNQIAHASSEEQGALVHPKV